MRHQFINGGTFTTTIKVIGDILSGNYQPTLTGNRIVDASLIDHFCQNLAATLHLPPIAVTAEHHWNFKVDPTVLYLVDQRIIQVTDRLLEHHNVIAVTHSDLLRGQVTLAQNQLQSKHLINTNKKDVQSFS